MAVQRIFRQNCHYKSFAFDMDVTGGLNVFVHIYKTQ